MRYARLAGFIAASLALAAPGAGAGEKSIKIGVLTDLTSFASTSMGPGSVVAGELAAKDFGGMVLGKPIEVISADMQSKPDLAVQIATEWYDHEDVDAIIDVPASAAALTIQRMANEKHRIFLATVAATTDLTGKQCSPIGVHWGTDTASYARGLVSAMAAGGAKTWFQIMPDFAVGKSTAENANKVIEAGGGKVLATVYHPTNSSDYSSYLLQAQQSGADVIGVGSIGLDLTTLIKQAVEFGILPSSKQKLASFLGGLSDVDAVGLKTMQNVLLVQNFYWDANADTRKFATEFFAIRKKMPNFTHANDYSGVLAYLTAMKEAGSDDPVKVVAKMHEHPMNMFGQKVTIREDGRVLYDMGLYRVKSPAESKYPWDYLQLEQTSSAEKNFLSLKDGGCPLIKNP